MSRILDLAQNFEAKSKQQAHDTELRLKSEFERHEKFIEQALRSSEQKITSDINAQNQRMSALVLKSWIWLGLSVFLVVIASTGAIWWQGKIILTNQQEIKRQKLALEKLNAKTWGIRFYQDSEGRYLMLPKGYTVKGGWTLNDGQNELIKLVEK